MCGITGFVSNKIRNKEECIVRMISSLKHRGPDEYGAFISNNCCLSNARLSINGLQNGVQPFSDNSNKIICVFNGEIFNFKELNEKYQAKKLLNKQFRNLEGDSIISSYIKRDFDFLKELKGQFAIAILDMNKNKLILARDRFGIRPMFYSLNENGFFFGSEIKSIVSSSYVEFNLNDEILPEILTYWAPLGRNTSFKNIFSLLPGELLIFDLETKLINKTKYWDAAEFIQRNSKEKIDITPSELRNQFDLSVKRQSISDVSIGAYLSGGIDSSALCYAAKKNNNELKTFSIDFQNSSYSEGSAQNKVIKNLELDNITLKLDDNEIAKNLEKAIYHIEQPIFRTAPVPLMLLSKVVNENGIEVVFTGEGSDELFLGYDIFREIKIKKRIQKNPNSLLNQLMLGSLYAYMPQYQNPRFRKIIFDSYLNENLNKDFFGLDRRWKSNQNLLRYLSNPFKKGDSYSIMEDDTFDWQIFNELDDIEKSQYLELRILLSSYLLSSQGDRMSMANSVEGRYPFIDDDFAKLVLSIPKEQRLNGLKDKFILRKSFENLIPPEIVNRKKVAYQSPDIGVIQSCFTNKNNKELYEHLISDENLDRVGVFNKTLVDTIRKKIIYSNFSNKRASNQDCIISTLIITTLLFENNFKNLHKDETTLDYDINAFFKKIIFSNDYR